MQHLCLPTVAEHQPLAHANPAMLAQLVGGTICLLFPGRVLLGRVAPFSSSDYKRGHLPQNSISNFTNHSFDKHSLVFKSRMMNVDIVAFLIR